ncbi:MAG: diacylglycerol/lipid kinase family protein [Nakamurella sp.]
MPESKHVDGAGGIGELDPPLAGALRCAVVANPARVPDLEDRRRIIDVALAQAGWPAPSWSETTPQDPGTGQARRAVAAGAQVVLVCGGDGTVRAVIAGMLGTDAALAVRPAPATCWQPVGNQPRTAR